MLHARVVSDGTRNFGNKTGVSYDLEILFVVVARERVPKGMNSR